MADPQPPGDNLAPLVAELTEIKRQLRELQKPTGTQYANAVASLVGFGSIGMSAQAFTVPTVMTPVASSTLTVPPGYTQAAILGIVSVGAWNGSTAGAYLYVQALINGSPGASLPVYAAPSAYGEAGASAVRTLSGLTPGSTIPVAVQCYAASGWGANGSNIANIDVIALFKK